MPRKAPEKMDLSPFPSPAGLSLNSGHAVPFEISAVTDAASYELFPDAELRLYAEDDIEISESKDGPALQSGFLVPHTDGARTYYVRAPDGVATGDGTLRAEFTPDPSTANIGGGGVSIDKVEVAVVDVDIKVWTDEIGFDSYQHGDTIYFEKGEPGATATLTAGLRSDDHSYDWLPGEPTWTGGTPGDDELTIPIDQASQDSTGAAYTVQGSGRTATVHVVVVSITITTTGDLRLIQNPGETEIDINAFVAPPDLAVEWILIAQPDLDIYTQTNDGNLSTGMRQTTVTLDKTSGKWDNWDADTFAVVRIRADALHEANATTAVDALKFSRNGEMSPGSQDVSIPLPKEKPGEESEIGFTFADFDDPGPLAGRGISTSVQDDLDEEIDANTTTDANSEDWKLYYYSNSDIGDGTYSFEETVDFSTGMFTGGVYVGGGFPSIDYEATIAAAAVVSAGVNNETVDIPFHKLGIGYTGHPMTVTIGVQAGKETVQGGVSVSVTLSEQDNIEDSHEGAANFVVEFEDTHIAKTEIDETKTVNIAAGINLTQENDGEWYLAASSVVAAWVPSTPTLVFTPAY